MSRPIVEQVVERTGYPILTEENYQDFVENEPACVVFFGGSPSRYPESDDVIVVLPELEKAFPGAFRVAVVSEDAEVNLAKQYGFSMWPALVFLKKGKFVDMITRIQDWSVYMEEIPKILEKSPGRAPSIGIPVEAK